MCYEKQHNISVPLCFTELDLIDIFSVNYYLNGNISDITENDKVTSYVYDNIGRLTKETVSNEGETLYTYDNFSNRTAKISRDVNGNILSQTDYQYNKNNQLISEISGNRTTSYGYDINGNLTYKTYTELSDVENGENTFTMGNIPTNYMEEYTYDALNRLSAFSTNQITASYVYDGNGLRQSKTINGITENHIYDGQNIVKSGNQTFIRGIGLISRNVNGNKEYYSFNVHGDTTKLTDAFGTILKDYSYDAFGNQKTQNENDTNLFRYSGEFFDEESGLIYLRARYYDPATGRFISEDPIKDGLNWYVYCSNNPVKYIDPSGTVPVETIIDLASIGWSFSDFVSNPSWANFGFLAWDVAAALVPYAPGSYSAKTIKAGTQILSKSDNYVKSGVWAMKAFDRGYEIEKALGGMANNFPVIDKYVKSQCRAGIMWLSSVTSIKSIDITASSYKSGNTMKNLLKKYVDDLAAFKGKSYKDTYYQLESCGNKILEIAIPPVEMTSNQAKVFKEIKEYATEKGIELITRIVE